MRSSYDSLERRFVHARNYHGTPGINDTPAAHFYVRKLRRNEYNDSKRDTKIYL